MAELQESGVICDLYQLAPLMRLEAIDIVETHRGDLERHWYSSPGPAEFLFLIRKEKLIKHRLDLFGQVIEWNSYDGTKTGFLEVSEIPGVLQPSSTISFDGQPDEDLLRMAGQFVNGIDVLSDDIKQKVTNHYEPFFRWDRLTMAYFFKKLIRGRK